MSLYNPEGQGLCLMPFCLPVWKRTGYGNCVGGLTHSVRPQGRTKTTGWKEKDLGSRLTRAGGAVSGGVCV